MAMADVGERDIEVDVNATSDVQDARARLEDAITIVRPGGSIIGSRLSKWRWSMRGRSSENGSEQEFIAPTDATSFLEVRPAVFAAIWWAMVVIHIVCAVILTVQTRLYLYLRNPFMSYYMNLIEPDITAKYSFVAANFGVLAAFHWTTVTRLVYYSIQQRKYAFFPASYYEAEIQPHIQKAPETPPLPLTIWQRFTKRLHGLRVALWGRRGLLGVESRFFYQYFYLREAVELTSQIYQAYRGSLLVARAWINHLSIGIIVVNCLFTPAVQIHYKKRPEIRRIAMLTLDAVLDFLTAMVVPLSIFSPYFFQFDRASHSFPPEKLYDETWFINAVLDNQEFLIVSAADIIFKTIPHISITGCLKKVRHLIRKDTSVKVISAETTTVVYATTVAPVARRQRAQEKLERIQRKAKLISQQLHAERDSRGVAVVRGLRYSVSRVIHKYGNKLVRVVFVSIGLSVLGIHLQGIFTSYRASKIGCKQVMRPWFASAFACSIFEVNCLKLHINGSASEVQQTLAHLYRPAIAALVFTHCPALEMPPELTTYKHLMRLDVYNSTIVGWNDSAALTNQRHPMMASLSFARVAFKDGQLPSGLINEAFPNALRSVEISKTNLTDLPSDLHLRWTNAMSRVFIEHSNLTRVPETLRLLDVETLSLEGNEALATVDPVWLQDYPHQYLTLGLACNPKLSELPATIHSQTSLRFLRLQFTNVSALPPWIMDPYSRVGALQDVFASHTPLCSDAASPAHASDVVACVAINSTIRSNDTARAQANTDACGLYPMKLIDTMRRASL